MDESLKSKLHKEHELESMQSQFAAYLLTTFKVELQHRLKEWYKLEWNDFRKEILKTGETLSYRRQHDLKEYFIIQQKKVLSLRQELSTIKYDLLKTGIGIKQ
jgi:hypothetical protein